MALINKQIDDYVHPILGVKWRPNTEHSRWRKWQNERATKQRIDRWNYKQNNDLVNE